MSRELSFPNLNVIPAGYRWTPEAAKKAGTKFSFLKVGGDHVTRRALSGAKRFWNSQNPEDNRIIFHTGYRIAGTPEEITQALTYAGIDSDTIEQVLSTSITKDNYQSSAAGEYKQEIANYEAFKQTQPKATSEGYDWEQILWFAANIKDAVIASKSGYQTASRTETSVPRGRSESLRDKITKLAPGKVIDVSNMDVKTGGGHRTINVPKSSRKGKYGTDRVPIVSNDLNKYIRGIQLAYGDEGLRTFANDIEIVRGALSNTGGPVPVNLPVNPPSPRRQAPPSPVRTKLPSPTKAAPVLPGATLASPPKFVPVGVVPQVKTPRGVPTVGGTGFPNIPSISGVRQ